MMMICQFLWHMFLLTGFCSKMMDSKNMVSSVQFRWWYVVNFNGTCFNCLDFVRRWWIAKTLSVQFRWRCVVNFYGTFPLSEFCSKMTYSKNMVSSVQSFNWLGCQRHMRDDSAGILFQPFLQETLVSSCGRGRGVHSLMLSIQHFLCWPQRCSLSKMPWRTAVERLLWHVTCLNHASFHLFTW